MPKQISWRMLQRSTLLFLTLVSSSILAQALEGEQLLSEQSREDWRLHIRPDAEEVAWKKIDWKPDLGSGIADASKSGKPILLWTMNGHPLGCT